MKKYTYNDKYTRGSLPQRLFKYIDMDNIRDATVQFSEFITNIAKQFHSKLNVFGEYSILESIELNAPYLFGQPVDIKYVGSGITGTVYKITVGSESFALKINRASRIATDEIENMHLYGRSRNLVNRIHIAAPFKNEYGEEFTWLLSDYIEQDSAQSFFRACEKLYFAYITKGIAFSDAHYNNFKNGKIIDSDSFRMRIDDADNFYKLSRTDIDTVKKLMRFVKIDDKKSFEDLLKKSNKNVKDYIFFSMLYARGNFFPANNKNNDFINKIISFEKIVQKTRQIQTIKEKNFIGQES